MERLQRIFLYIFCFSLNFEVWDPLSTGGFFSISKLTGMLYFLSSLPAIFHYRTSSQFKPILLTIGVFFGYLTLVNGLNINLINNVIIEFTMLQSIILFWVLLNHVQSDPLVMERSLLYFAFGSVTLAILYYAGIGIEVVDQRVSIFGDNENIIGQRMSFSIVIIVLAVIQNRLQLKKSRFLLLLLIPIMIDLLIASGSRLAIVSLLAVFIASVLLLKTSSTFTKVTILAIGIIGFIVVFQLLMNNEIVGERLQRSFQEGDLSSRDDIWKSILPLIKQNPIFGVGKTGYAYYCNAVFGRYWSPHNVILEILCFSGFIGLGIYMYFLYRIFRIGYLAYKADGTLLPIMFMINIVGLLLVSHLLELKIGWALLAYIATSNLSQASRNKEALDSPPDESLIDEGEYEWIEARR